MQKVADKIIAELKALIELNKSIKEMSPADEDYDFICNDFDPRRTFVIGTIIFFQEELKPFEGEILDLVNELEGRV